MAVLGAMAESVRTALLCSGYLSREKDLEQSWWLHGLVLLVLVFVLLHSWRCVAITAARSSVSSYILLCTKHADQNI